MPIPAQSIIRRCVETLQDNTSIRWPVSELVRYLNDAQREVILYRPDSMVTNATLTCAAGTKQSLPTNGAKLIEVIRNAAATSAKKSVRMVNREILDAQTPGWHNITGSVDILHFMYDPRDPKTFYVYPPATTAAQLDIVYAAYPTDVMEPADGALYTAVTGNISLPDIYGNALLDYVLARCFMKDSEYAGNAQRAQAHYQLFATALGVELKGTMSFGPTAKSALAGGAASSAMAS
jgi:hypothetical protein